MEGNGTIWNSITSDDSLVRIPYGEVAEQALNIDYSTRGALLASDNISTAMSKMRSFL
jgi:hypothetical protein